jgi:N-acetylglucosamine kinase-like BadF-type ATPase
LKNFLLLESGATKLSWVLASPQQVLCQGEVSGLHPFLSGPAEWKENLEIISTRLRDYPPLDRVFYYGTGCSESEGQTLVKKYFTTFTPILPSPLVATDLLAAARALCQQDAGVVGILGTGSNAARYDGLKIADQRGGLGYVLGDEGSGAHLGKMLLQAFLRQQLPAAIQKDLQATYQLSKGGIISTVYQTTNPSRYLAQFAPALKRWLPESSFLQEKVAAGFGQFTDLYLLPLLVGTGLSEVAFTGSIAIQFRPYLERALQQRGLAIKAIIAPPLPELIIYHQATR